MENRDCYLTYSDLHSNERMNIIINNIAIWQIEKYDHTHVQPNYFQPLVEHIEMLEKRIVFLEDKLENLDKK